MLTDVVEYWTRYFPRKKCLLLVESCLKTKVIHDHFKASHALFMSTAQFRTKISVNDHRQKVVLRLIHSNVSVKEQNFSKTTFVKIKQGNGSAKGRWGFVGVIMATAKIINT